MDAFFRSYNLADQAKCLVDTPSPSSNWMFEQGNIVNITFEKDCESQ